MTHDGDGKIVPAEAVRQAIRESEFLKGLAAARAETAQARGLRALQPDEIAGLQDQHNAAEDWAKVRVPPDFNPRKIAGCYFTGEILLGSFRHKVALGRGLSVGSGVYNCHLHNVSVGDDAYVANTSLVANCHIGPRAVILGCGRIVCLGETSFGNGQRISLGLEMPGRETALYAEITVEVAAQVAAHRHATRPLAAYERLVAEYTQAATANFGVIEAGAAVLNTPRIVNAYIGPGAQIDAAGSLENVTVLSTPEESVWIGTGACVRDSLVQWGCRLETHATVEQSVCCEHSFVDNQGQLRRSLLGPNSGVTAGECSYSLVGPFVGFHHEGLLISAYWPAGKGTVAYGANVGAEHTGKAADQEIWPGEGLFFGLGVNVKFPADYSKAPYTILASGVTTLPQRLEMPFSLVNVPAERIPGVSPAYNEILPGWVLSESIYSVRRNERKYAVRNKARRTRCIYEILRPEVVDLMIHARAMLQGVKPPAGESGPRVYTDKDIPGLGKNFLEERARRSGIEAYTFYIRLYALKGLLFSVKFCLQQGRDANRVLEPEYVSDPRYEHERALLCQEFPGRNVKQLLHELVAAHEKVAADTLLSKEKDDFRGVRIIPDYITVHVPAREDPFVKVTQHEVMELKAEVAELLKKL
ncbi:MAG: DUF4954 family protein [Planctomycetota bacterium]